MWTAKASLAAMFLPRVISATTIFPLGSMIAVSQIRAYALSEEWDFEMPSFHARTSTTMSETRGLALTDDAELS